MKTVRILACLLLSLSSWARAADSFYLKDGDRVVFYGDSITDQRLYTTYTETFVVTRFPHMKVAFTHSGWGGDSVMGGGGGPIDLRLKRDVFAYKPTVMTIMLGMNDARYRPFDEKIFDTYAKGIRRIVDRVKTEFPDIRLTLIQPSPFDDVTRAPTFKDGYNAVLVRYGQYLKELASETHVDLADLNTSVVEATRKAYEREPEKAKELNHDRVHPGPGGQLLMAAALLKAWNAPSLVSEVRVKVGKGEAAADAKNAEVNHLTSQQGDLTSWTQRDASLPFPINLGDQFVKLAVDSSNVVRDLDEEFLRVEGLDDGDYVLTIDGQKVGEFSADKLAEGVNLALLKTPMSEQAAKVHGLTLQHNNIHFARWRGAQVPLQGYHSPNLTKALEALDAFEAEVVAEQAAAAQPKAHEFQLRPKK
jgi:lysophospholipase L1-like esterase